MISKSKVERRSQVRVMARDWLSDRAFMLRLSRPSAFEFQPGHRIRIFCQGSQRDYSLSSTPEDNELELCIRHVAQGVCSPALAVADIGADFEMTGPHGYFLFHASSRPAVFVATGTGIAPFVSMIRSGIQNVTVLHGVGDSHQLYYKSLFRSSAARYVPCLSKQVGGSVKEPNAFRGRVTGFLKDRLSPKPHDFYLCGRSEMIRDVTYLVDDQFPGSLIHSEIFY